MIELRPIGLRGINAAIDLWHRHHDPIRAKVIGVAAYVDDVLQGVAAVETPKAQGLCDGTTLEVTRLAIRPDRFDRNVGSRLLGACWRACKAIGCRRLVSYIRVDETGSVYCAAGWCKVADVRGRGWNSGNKAQRWLPGLYEPATEIIDRQRWEIGIDNRTPLV